MASAPAKRCSRCGADVTNAPRVKDAAGNYFCQHCAQPAAPAPAAPATQRCSVCGRPTPPNLLSFTPGGELACPACAAAPDLPHTATCTRCGAIIPRPQSSDSLGLLCPDCASPCPAGSSPKPPKKARRRAPGIWSTLRSVEIMPRWASNGCGCLLLICLMVALAGAIRQCNHPVWRQPDASPDRRTYGLQNNPTLPSAPEHLSRKSHETPAAS